ncbi:hypothetical protein CLAFUW4_05715 [Fulvia fulva]|nr:hypothetical protein CLAFUR4_05709 [Fulvia fulva]WPV15025.1 hypothetical protein CLAFUW4_05715 [Fulvia fulva]WPV30447.1 hypothetical protein CLAFUW7_05713 [Fulvia fulva]
MNHKDPSFPSSRGQDQRRKHHGVPLEQYARAGATDAFRSDCCHATISPQKATGHGRREMTKGAYSPGPTYDSPSEHSSEEELMELDDNNNASSTDSDRGESPRASTTAILGRLSLDQARSGNTSPQRQQQRGILSASGHVTKRRASIELSRPGGRQSLKWSGGAKVAEALRSPEVPPKHQRRSPSDRLNFHRTTSGEGLGRRMMEAKCHVSPFAQSHERLKEFPVRNDSGYVPHPSGMNTSSCVQGASVSPGVSVSQGIAEDVGQLRSKGRKQLPPHGRYPGLILQPDSSPISQEQLAAEVKGIYAGLVMVEAKCINIDAAQAADPNSQLGAEQWQALIALHRTLLYEHHDFLMATQHPSATPALRGLATKYSMPARMWKHGIHAFLEVLRHRRPASQDYMLAFIYLAYQMMALLYETVPTFTDTWIECLGDLARYRMAIEEEKEAHAIWGGVAARWYILASDRHPAIGRLYHHLGILERPSLRKLCLYTKSLTCVIPFPNARDSLLTLCNPIVQDEHTVQTSFQSAEARIVTFHALNYTGNHERVIDLGRSDALRLLVEQPTKLREFGAYFAITNSAAILEYGSPTNPLAQQYSMIMSTVMQKGRPSGSSYHPPSPFGNNNDTPDAQAFLFGTSFWIDSFNHVLQQYNFATILDNALGFLHVNLVFLHSLHSLRLRLLNSHPQHTFRMPFSTGRLSWSGLASFLNALLQHYPISARILECSRQGVFLSRDPKVAVPPLSEDYLIRGLSWTQSYFPAGLFDAQCEDDGRAIETSVMQDARAERVLWLALYLAFHTEDLQYNLKTKTFSGGNPARPQSHATPVHSAEADVTVVYTDQVSSAESPCSRSSRTASSSPESDDGFTLVKVPNSQQGRASPRETKGRNVNAFGVARKGGVTGEERRFRGVMEDIRMGGSGQ